MYPANGSLPCVMNWVWSVPSERSSVDVCVPVERETDVGTQVLVFIPRIGRQFQLQWTAPSPFDEGACCSRKAAVFCNT